MLRRTKLRRTFAALLLLAGGILMWLAPAATFAPLSFTGIVLLVAGVALEVVGIALEHRAPDGPSEGREER